MTAAVGGAPDLEETFARLGPAVLGYLRAAGAADPDDVLGEVFVRVARRIRRFRGGDRELRSWVFTIARNCLADEYRRRGRQRRLHDRLTVPAPAATGEALDPALVGALALLTPVQRQVVVLRFVADLPLADVARLAGTSEGAVKSLQHRALASLRAILSDDRLAGRTV